MERIISTSKLEVSIPQKRVPVKKAPERGTAGPVRIGELLEPIQKIINHPDRNSMMAELFKDYK